MSKISGGGFRPEVERLHLPLMLKSREIGSGPRLLLFHGAAAPEVGWEKQEALGDEFKLIIPWRRGYGESPPAEQQDFEADSEDILELLGTHSAHAAAYSYGGVGLLAAASQRPQMFLSLSLIEVPLFNLAGDDPAVQEMLGKIAELPGMQVLGKLAGERGFPQPPPMRNPFEAEVDYEAIRSEGMPILVVSGDHHPGWERTCDALAEKLGADRASLPGSGHAPQRSDGFNNKLREFLAGHDLSP
jgi:pimeloyl-ACP methyl ester carboxylesterase